MKNILIADDNAVTVSMLSKVLTAHCNIFNIFTAKDGQDALDIIKTKKLDLVITDLSMPRMNGFALIEHLLKSDSKIPIIVISAYGTPEIEAKLKSIPRIKYFSKPLKTDRIIDTVFEKLEITYGQIDGIGLSSFLQLVEMEGKTCTLSVKSKSGDRTGTLYFLEGALISAETDSLKNESAAYEIISWDNTKIQIVDSISKQEVEITQPLMNILMEAARLKDEKEAKTEPEKNLNKSKDTADKDYIEQNSAVFNEIILEDQQTQDAQLQQFDDNDLPQNQTELNQSQKPDKPAESITPEQLLQSGPIAETLQKMKDSLVKVMGPISEIVFVDSLNTWIEAGKPSQDSIPILVTILEQEINDADNINKYHEMIDPYI